MRAARRSDLHWRISDASAKFVNAIRIHTKDRRIAISPHFGSPLERVSPVYPGEVLLQLIKVAVRPENRPAGLVVGLIQTVGKSNPRLRVITRREKRRAPDIAQRRVRR